MTLTAPIQGLVIGALCGLSQAAGVIVGKRLGGEDYDGAYRAAKRLMGLWRGRSLRALRREVPRDIDAAGGGVGQGMRDAAAVADDEQALVRRLQILVDGDLHVVEFDLNAVKQRIVVRRTGGDLVKRVDHLDDAVENALRDDQRQIARRSRQRGGDEGFVDALLASSAGRG